MRKRFILLAAAALAAACDGGDTLDPQDRVLATGTYGYEGRWLHPATLEWDTISGELVVDASTPDSVHGRWFIQGFVSDSTAGYWNENAYVLTAISNNGQVIVTHRLSAIREADFIYVMDGGRVVQAGTWHELAQTPGPFATLLEAQGLPAGSMRLIPL